MHFFLSLEKREPGSTMVLAMVISKSRILEGAAKCRMTYTALPSWRRTSEVDRISLVASVRAGMVASIQSIRGRMRLKETLVSQRSDSLALSAPSLLSVNWAPACATLATIKWKPGSSYKDLNSSCDQHLAGSTGSS